MIDTRFLPLTVADTLKESVLFDDPMDITFTGFVDEKSLYSRVNKMLIELEISDDIRLLELETIIRLSKQFPFACEEQDEVLTRIDSLQRLYKAKQELDAADTKKKAKQIRNFIASVPTCPLKKHVLAKLDSLEQMLPEETPVETDAVPTKVQLLTNKALEEAGDVFVNLGKYGRNYVISEVLKDFGDKSGVEHITDYAVRIEQQVQYLAEVNDCNEMIARLDQLPLASFHGLESNRKEKVAALLIKNSKWSGLLSLDRTISQLNRKMIEEESTLPDNRFSVELQDGSVAATTLDEKYMKL
ncbi:hypothetical protein ACAF76_001575 [Brevibacillus sp. TJ4]|uniref:hypothetical protein n=1 Tax=Brevibacillus sp. TJ4 TaxID=3234853 RepID=UPI0037D3ADE4